jgi:hypothetical protein
MAGLPNRLIMELFDGTVLLLTFMREIISKFVI